MTMSGGPGVLELRSHHQPFEYAPIVSLPSPFQSPDMNLYAEIPQSKAASGAPAAGTDRRYHRVKGAVPGCRVAAGRVAAGSELRMSSRSMLATAGQDPLQWAPGGMSM